MIINHCLFVSLAIVIGCRAFELKSDQLRQRRMTSILVTGPANTSCAAGQFMCTNGACVEQSKVCDSVDDCSDRSDEVRCKISSNTCWSWQSSCSAENGTCLPNYFQCGNGKCVNFTTTCNNLDNCGDRSDEQRAVPGLKCSYGSRTDVCVLPQRYVNTSQTYCRDETDRCYDSRGQFICFQCFDKRLLIGNTQICDGVFDCHDLSDECLCPSDSRPPICDNVCMRTSQCQMKTFTCGNTTHNLTDICDRKINCPDGEDEKFCRKSGSSQLKTCPGSIRNKTLVTAYVCDGRPECYDLSDECGAGCNYEPPFCKLVSRFQSNTSFVIRCPTASGFRYALTKDSICDGLWSPCYPRIPEEEMSCPARFNCTSGSFISIDNSLVCDGYWNCDNGEDERNCTKRFRCSSGKSPVSVPKSFMFDDFWDCDDGSDECPPITLNNRNFASRHEMIENVFLKVWLWIMALMALGGNTFVIVKSLVAMRGERVSEPVALMNHFLIFNLGVADWLMGLYLLAMAIYSVVYSGRYCFVDEIWRTGPICTGFGALSVVASETSVLMLSVLTAVRLYVISRPIAARNLKFVYIVVITLLAWALAILLAVLPLSSFFSDVVTDSAWLPSKYYNTSSLNLKKATHLSDRVGILSPDARPLTTYRNQILPWVTIESFLQQNGSGNVIRGLFGYYSLNSVCVSKWFVRRNSPGWEFTIAVVTLNMILFVFVASSYLVIYLKSTASSKIQSTHSDRSSRMQRKIIKLVITDFACSIPICIMVFIHFSEVAMLNGVYYVVIAVVLLPINSVLNPLLYSGSFEFVWKKLKELWKNFHASLGGSCTADPFATHRLGCDSNGASQSTNANVENNYISNTNVSASNTQNIRTKITKL